MNETQASAATPSETVAPVIPGANTPPVATPGSLDESAIDFSKMSLADMETMLQGGTIEVPLKAPATAVQQESAPPAAPAAPVPPAAPAPVAPPATPVAPAPAEPAPTPEAPAVVPTPEAPAAVPPVAPVAATPPAPAVETEEELSKRYRLTFEDPHDQRVAATKRANPALTWQECDDIVKRGNPSAAPTPTLPSTTEVLQTQQTRLAELQADAERIISEENGFASPEFVKTQNEISKISGEIAVLNYRAEQEQAQANHELQQREQAVQVRRQDAHTQATTLFPDVAVKGSALNAAVTARIEAMKNPNHPEHETLYADAAPLIVARLVAAEMGIAATQAPSPAVPPVAQVPGIPVVPQTRPAPTAPGSLGTSVPATSQPVTLESAKEMSLEDLDKGFGASGVLLTVR